MKKREFNKLMKQITDKKNRINVKLISKLSDDQRDGIVHMIVRYRKPIVKDLITDTFSWSWLHSMGYLYTTEGEYYTYVHTSEHEIH